MISEDGIELLAVITGVMWSIQGAFLLAMGVIWSSQRMGIEPPAWRMLLAVLIVVFVVGTVRACIELATAALAMALNPVTERL